MLTRRIVIMRHHEEKRAHLVALWVSDCECNCPFWYSSLFAGFKRQSDSNFVKLNWCSLATCDTVRDDKNLEAAISGQQLGRRLCCKWLWFCNSRVKLDNETHSHGWLVWMTAEAASSLVPKSEDREVAAQWAGNCPGLGPGSGAGANLAPVGQCLPRCVESVEWELLSLSQAETK